MIPRYSRAAISKIWLEETKFQIWLEIELAACEAMAELGDIPTASLKIIKEKAQYDVERIKQIESVVKHDVIAFVTNVGEYIGEDGRFLHKGMTSSDLLDTALSLRLRQSCDILLQDIKELLDSLREKALATKYLLCVGRSHGVHAEPITLGLKFARFYAEFQRNYQRLLKAKEEISICKISGAVGTFANIHPYVEEYIAKKLGLKTEIIATQVIPRDRHAHFFCTLALIASSIENIAVELRHLQRTEVLEVAEKFSEGQKGSSAMPHKQNPILCENITGLARVVRSCVVPALENIALWHERDISHSSVERFIAPEACITLDFALARLTEVIQGLVIFEENIARNLRQLKGLIFSQRIMLELINSGLTREEAYSIVQKHALSVWEENRDFFKQLKQDKEITNRLGNKLEDIFDLNYHTKYVDSIFSKVFSESINKVADNK